MQINYSVLRKMGAFILFMILPLGAGIIGSTFTSNSISEWYVFLDKPELSPPNWVFGPVWTILYILMGISAFVFWKKTGDQKFTRIALAVFLLQLFLNAVWSIIFFGFRNPGAAFVEIIFLWIAIVINAVLFYKSSKVSAFLFLPYILWVSFAAYLNYSIWILNY